MDPDKMFGYLGMIGVVQTFSQTFATGKMDAVGANKVAMVFWMLFHAANFATNAI